MDDREFDRTDLQSQIIEPDSPDPAFESYYRHQLQQRYADPYEALAPNGGIETGTADGASLPQAQSNSKEDDYAFRLFTRPSAASLGFGNGTQRITLRSPSPVSGQPGLKNGGRPQKYYFASDTDPELAQQYARAAVSGQDIMKGLEMRWRGMELPWRVTVIKATVSGKGDELEHEPHRQTNRRKRIGKKRRIMIRQKSEARVAQEVEAGRDQIEREAAEREKRTRKNREKKVKKKQKEKLKKANKVQDTV